MRGAAAAAAPVSRRSFVVWVVAALAAAFALRVVAGIALNVQAGGMHRGFGFYGFMADNLLDGRGLVWSFYNGLGDKWANRAPLYPLVVAAIRFVAGRTSAVPVIVGQAAIGAAACLVPALFALRWGGRRAAVVAVWVAAAWPYAVVTDTGLVEHVVYAPLAGLAVLFALRARDAAAPSASIVAGLASGLATLARVTFAVSIPFLALATWRRSGGFVRVGLVAAGVAAVFVPWIVRNHAVTGAYVLGTDGGRALWVGNTAATFGHYPAGSIDDSERDMLADLAPADVTALRATTTDEVAQDRVFREMAVREIAARPAAAAWGGLRKAAALWSPLLNPGPSSAGKLLVFGASFVLVLAAACAGAVAAPRIRADLPVCLATAFSFTLVAAVFWGQSRYLAPLHGIAIAAGAAWWASRARAAECAA